MKKSCIPRCLQKTRNILFLWRLLLKLVFKLSRIQISWTILRSIHLQVDKSDWSYAESLWLAQHICDITKETFFKRHFLICSWWSWFGSGVGNLRHACHSWHADGKAVALRGVTTIGLDLLSVSIFWISKITRFEWSSLLTMIFFPLWLHKERVQSHSVVHVTPPTYSLKIQPLFGISLI